MTKHKRKKDWSAMARRALVKEARALNVAERATPKVAATKARLREEANQAMIEFQSRQPDVRKTLDDFLHKKY